MRKLLFLIIVVAAIIGSIPFIIGYQFKQQFIAIVTSLPAASSSAIKVEVIEYRLGWLNSFARLRVSSTDPAFNKYYADGIIIDDLIAHGPIVFDSVTNQYKLGAATIVSYVYLPQSLQKMLTSNQENKPFSEIQIIIMFGNVWHSITKIMPISLPWLGELRFADSTSTARFELQNNQLTEFSTTHDTGAISFKSNGDNTSITSFYIQPSRFIISATRAFDSIWNTSQNLSIPSITLNAGNQSLAITNITGDFKQGIDASRLYQLSTNFQIKTINSPAYFITDFTDIRFLLEMNDLNPDGLNTFGKAARVNPKFAVVTLRDMFTPTSKLNLSLSFNSSAGALNSMIKIAIMPTDVFIKAQLDSSIVIAELLLTKLVTNYIETMDKQRPPLPPANPSTLSVNTPTTSAAPAIPNAALPADLTSSKSSEQRAQEMITGWLQEGYLIKQEGNYIINISVNEGILKINGKIISQPTIPLGNASTFAPD